MSSASVIVTVTVGETDDIDWINNWKQYFHQFYIDDILVIPSWEEAETEETPAHPQEYLPRQYHSSHSPPHPALLSP